jgi:hypothetical protein
MSENYTLWHARAAAGVHDDGRVLGTRVNLPNLIGFFRALSHNPTEGDDFHLIPEWEYETFITNLFLYDCEIRVK